MAIPEPTLEGEEGILQVNMRMEYSRQRKLRGRGATEVQASLLELVSMAGGKLL